MLEGPESDNMRGFCVILGDLASRLGVILVIGGAVWVSQGVAEVKQAAVSTQKLVSGTVKVARVSATTVAPRVAVVKKPSATVVVTHAPLVAGEFTKTQAATLVENYFNGLTTLKAEFAQRSTGEAFVQEGTFYLKKPRQFVWQYETPNRQRVIGTGTAVYYQDQSSGPNGQVTQLPNNGGMSFLFGGKKVSLAEQGLKVTEVVSNNREVRVSMVTDTKRRDDMGGVERVNLGFARKGGTLELALLEAVDITGVLTKLQLANVQRGVVLDKNLFAFVPPQYREN